MHKARLVSGLAAIALLAGVAPSSAQTTVPVTLDNGASSRTLHVESMTGQTLSSLDFNSSRSLPFRVKVVDSSFTRTPFTVSATMTNLYLDNAGLKYDTLIASSDVRLGSQLNPLNVLGVSAAVQPLVDTVSTVADGTICNVLGVVTTLVNGVPTCTLTASGLTGNLQNVNVNVDLGALTNLPLLPQANETGAFTNAEFGSGTAGAGDTAGKAAAATAGVTATGRRVISGAPVTTGAVLSALRNALTTNPLATLVPQSSVTAALQAQYSATWMLLSSTQITTILASTAGTAQALLPAQVLSQTGTYVSLPTLDVTVPSGIPAGKYSGTLVVTALQ